MKKLKKIVFVIFVVIGMFFYLNEDAISTYAVNYDDEVFKVGNVYKSGDVITVRDKEMEIEDSGYSYTVDLSYAIEYYINGELDYDIHSQLSTAWGDGYTFTVPQYQGLDVYWTVTSVSEPVGEYNFITVKMALLEHKEPVFKLGCADETINPGKSTKCTVSADFYSTIEYTKLKLDIKDFTISDEKGVGKWVSEKIPNKENEYMIAYNDSDSSVTTNKVTRDLFEFTLTAPNNGKTTSLKDNVKITDVAYSDLFVDFATSDDVKTTLNMKEVEEPKAEEPKKEEPKKEEPKVEEPKVEEPKKVEENPKTGIKNYQVLIFILSLICVASVYFFKKKNYLNKI